jgi:hypothetical protein
MAWQNTWACSSAARWSLAVGCCPGDKGAAGSGAEAGDANRGSWRAGVYRPVPAASLLQGTGPDSATAAAIANYNLAHRSTLLASEVAVGWRCWPLSRSWPP